MIYKINTILFLILLISVIALCIALDYEKKKKSKVTKSVKLSNKEKGIIGEQNIYNELAEKIEIYKRILYNVRIPTNNQKETQIDLILITSVGIYVIESKNFYGTIYAKDTDKYWTICAGSKKYSYPNPINQNSYHINNLITLLNMDIRQFKSYIVFGSNANLTHVTNKNPYITIVNINDLIDKVLNDLKNDNVVLSYEQVDQLYLRLKDYENNN